MEDILKVIAEHAEFFIIPMLFIGIVFYVYRSRNRSRFQKDAEIPFEDDRHGHD